MTNSNPSSPSVPLLLDTPKRLSLTTQSNALRADLKAWEKSFAAAHDGRKADRADIKRHPEVAKKYKEYNRIRDVLAGKISAVSAAASSSSSRRDSQSRTSKAERNHGRSAATKAPAHIATPRKRSTAVRDLHPSTVDPYDPPPTNTPSSRHTPRVYTFRQVIGPTPQRDGKALGLFDLLSSSGSSHQATPLSRRRKADALKEVHRNVVQTPSRHATRKTQSGYDLLEHLDPLMDDNENDPSGAVGRRWSRTPASEGKKFLLSQFFATPTVGRFASIKEERVTAVVADREINPLDLDRTPLRTAILQNRTNILTPQHVNEKPPLPVPSRSAVDATPPYLKRSQSSFNQRLLSASSLPSHHASTSSQQQKNASSLAAASTLTFSSPKVAHHGPRSLRPSNGRRSLSEIVQNLRKLEDERFEDDEEAMRELEEAGEGGGGEGAAGDGDENLQTEDSQKQDHALDSGGGVKGASDSLQKPGEVEGRRPWKKKGAKRTTRRVNMRPNMAKPVEAPVWHDESDDNDNDGGGEEEVGGGKGAESESEDELTCVEETQLLAPAIPFPSPSPSQASDGDELLKEADARESEDQDGDYENEGPPRKRKKQMEISEPSTVAIVTAPKVIGKANANAKRKQKGDKTEKAEPKKPRTYNPNATSHQNFRSLKIRNRNSKGRGGGGRFGGRGKGRRR